MVYNNWLQHYKSAIFMDFKGINYTKATVKYPCSVRLSFPVLYTLWHWICVHCHPHWAGFLLLKAMFRKKKKKHCFWSVENIDLQNLAELQEASWIILKQKVENRHLVLLCDTRHRNSWKTVPRKKQLKETKSNTQTKPVYIPKGTLCYENEQNPVLKEWKEWFSVALSWCSVNHKIDLEKNDQIWCSRISDFLSLEWVKLQKQWILHFPWCPFPRL